jgi:hypothetical protein
LIDGTHLNQSMTYLWEFLFLLFFNNVIGKTRLKAVNEIDYWDLKCGECEMHSECEKKKKLNVYDLLPFVHWWLSKIVVMYGTRTTWIWIVKKKNYYERSTLKYFFRSK